MSSKNGAKNRTDGDEVTLGDLMRDLDPEHRLVMLAKHPQTGEIGLLIKDQNVEILIPFTRKALIEFGEACLSAARDGMQT